MSELTREEVEKMVANGADVIEMADYLNKKGYRPVVLLDPEHSCTGCALCAVVCPDGCITVYRDVPQRAKEARSHAPAVA